MSELSRKEREFQARKEDIIKAAIEVFSQRGFAAATMEEIAEKANFGKGTIYNYFSSKLVLFHTLIDLGVEAIIDIYTQIAEQNIPPVEKLRLLLHRQLDFFQEHAGIFRIISTELQLPHLELQRICQKIENKEKIVAEVFAEGIKQGLFKQVEPLKLTILFSGFLHACVFHYWLNVKKNVPLTEEEISEMLGLFLSGVLIKEQAHA